MGRIHIGGSGELAEGGAIRFRVRHQGRQAEAFAIRVGEDVRGFINVCTHRALELDLGMGNFHTSDGTLLRCMAHGAIFSLDGCAVEGPCPKGSALTRVQVIEEDGQIFALEEDDLASSDPAGR